MGGQFRENWKRMANKILPKNIPTAMENKDVLRVEDVDGIANLSPSDGSLIVGSGTIWTTLPIGSEGYVPKSIGGTIQWRPDVSGIASIDLSASGFVVGPALSTDSAIALYDGTTGKLIKNSSILSDGSGLSIATYLIVSGLTTLTNLNVTNNVSISGTTTLNNITILGNTTLGSLNLTGSVGDVLYATGVDSFGNLTIGSNGEVLTVVGGVPQWAVASGASIGAGGAVSVVVSTGTITILDTDYLVAISGATTVNLSAAPENGQRHIIKDSLGVASTTPITISGNGFLIDDLSTTSLVNNYESKTVIYVGPLGQWQLV